MMMKRENKTNRIALRITKSEHDWLSSYLKSDGKTISKFVRELLNEKRRKVNAV